VWGGLSRRGVIFAMGGESVYTGHGGNVVGVCEELGWDPATVLDCSASLNPFGPPSDVRRLLSDALPSVAVYPDLECRVLRRAVADVHGVSPSSVLIGNGSTEFIFLLPRVFRPRTVLITPPTYRDYYEAANGVGASVVSVEVVGRDSFCVSADLAFLCNPNNPTGIAVDADLIRRITARYPSTLFIVDEAYVELADDPSGYSLLSGRVPDNVVVLRTWTKTFAVPGLRLGYAIGVPAVITQIERLKEPWTVNGPALAVGPSFLERDEFVRDSARALRHARASLVEDLGTIAGLSPMSSQSNFLLIRLAEPLNADSLRDRLLRDRILIRSCADFAGLGSGYVRVAVRTVEENRRLVAGLASAVKEIACV
jgi:threonine-phosphate decarboxylase